MVAAASRALIAVLAAFWTLSSGSMANGRGPPRGASGDIQRGERKHASRHHSERHIADGEASERDPSDGQKQAGRCTAYADDTETEAAECETAEGEPADRDKTNRHIADSDDATCPGPSAEGDVDQGTPQTVLFERYDHALCCVNSSSSCRASPMSCIRFLGSRRFSLVSVA